MVSQYSTNDLHHHVSPLSAPSPHALDSTDREANAPEAVTPSTVVASPATEYSHARTSGTDQNAKQVLSYDTAEKIAVPAAYEYQTSPSPQVVAGQDHLAPKQEDAQRSMGGPPAARRRETGFKVLGVRKRTFYILLVAVCVIVAVAVGGGVGGALASNKSSSSSGTGDPVTTDVASSAASTPSSTPSTPSSGTPSTSAPSSTPTFLNQTNTDSGHFFQGFSSPNLTGSHTPVVSAIAGADFAFAVRSYEFIAHNTNCCLSFCRNATKAGWLGYLCESRTQKDAADAFSRVFVWCSDKRTDAVARGRCM